MKKMSRISLLLAGVVGLVLAVGSTVVAHDRTVIIPLQGRAIGNATPNDVIEGKTFSNATEKGLTGTLKQPFCGESITNSVGMTFSLFPAGTFIMGSPNDEPGRTENETQHQVTLTKSFYMQTTEVTQAQWDAVIVNNSRGINPSSFSGEGHPANNINWYEAASFANWLSVDEGLTPCYVDYICSGDLGVDFSCTTVSIDSDCTGYRLPSEAQWEYAARAGTTTALYNGDVTFTGCNLDSNLNKIGWYCGNADSTTHFVGWKEPNSCGLFDMSGNVLEWCQDWWGGDYSSESAIDPTGSATGSHRVLRSGGWFFNAFHARSAHRGPSSPEISNGAGFRLVLPSGQ